MEFSAAGPLARAQVSDTPGALYTVGSGKVGRVTSLRFANPTGADATIEVWLNGTTNPYCLIPERTIRAGESWPFKTPMDLAASTVINAVSDTASAVTAFVFGTEVAV